MMQVLDAQIKATATHSKGYDHIISQKCCYKLIRFCQAGLSKLYNHAGTATANRHRQSIRKQTFRLCRKLKFSIEGVFNLTSLISQQPSHQLVSQKCCG